MHHAQPTRAARRLPCRTGAASTTPPQCCPAVNASCHCSQSQAQTQTLNTPAEVSRSLHGWQDMMYVAAINCGDAANQAVCSFQNITHYPTIKVGPPSRCCATLAAHLFFPSQSAASQPM